MEIKGFETDMNAMFGLLTERRERADRASAEPPREDPVRDLAARLHPALMKLRIETVREEAAGARTFRLKREDGPLPPFQAGQYLSVKALIGGARVTRPYSISSAPYEAAGKEGFYEITIRPKEGGFFTGEVFSSWKKGIAIEASGPHGTFCWDPLRDTRQIVALAGGSGITPFRSILREVAAGKLDIEVTLFYGIRRPDETIFGEELRKMSGGRIRLVTVCSEPGKGWKGPEGFISAECLRTHADIAGKTLFVCGPPEMYRYLEKELEALAVPAGLVRRESFEPGSSPQEWTFKLTARRGENAVTLKATAGETLLVALERAGIAPDSQCRSGECGFCRSLLVAGEVFVSPDCDGRRAADRKFNFIHPCATFPLSDVEIKLPLTGAVPATGVFMPHYDAVVVGAGNGGLTAALKLAREGAQVLLLEQHNLPGGFATSFVRGRFEFEPSLHELSGVGSPEHKGFVRKFLQDEAGVEVDFLPVPEAYHLILKDEGINLSLPFGIAPFIAAVEKAVPGSAGPLRKYFETCRDITEAIASIARSKGPPDFQAIIDQYPSFVTTAGYSVETVTEKFGFPSKALQFIYPYWCYLGLPVDRMGFTIWALMLYSYFRLGAYIPRMTSHGLSQAVDSRIRALGGRTEYATRMEKILVEKGRVVGVETSRGERIATGQVIANCSPNLVYGKMVHPRSEAPEAAMKLANARSLGPSAFVVYLGLDASPDELGIESYGYFIAPTMDSKKGYESFHRLEPPYMQATVCLNRANPDASPPGTTILSLTALAGLETWRNVAPQDYVKTKTGIARAMIAQFSEATGAKILEHIEEIEIATPVTFARYTGSIKGSIYAYEQDPWDSVVARSMAGPQERFIKGLDFTGGYSSMGSGYESTILSGRTAGSMALARIRKEKG